MSAPRLLFCDLETNGLHKRLNHVLEIGLIAVDDDYKTLEETSILVRIPSKLAMREVDPFVHEMHTNNGLWADLQLAERTPEPKHGIRERYAEPAYDALLRASHDVRDFLQKTGYEVGKVILCGHSIHFDRGFIQEQLPAFEAWLSHRMLDFGAIGRFIREQAAEWDVPFIVEPPPMPHRGLLDARIELEEARNLRETLRAVFEIGARNGYYVQP